MENNENLELLIKQATRIAIQNGSISISTIQRKLGVGYPKAAKILDAMTERGYVSPSEEFRRSKVLMDKQIFEQTFGESFDEE